MGGPNGPFALCLHYLLNSDVPILSDDYEPQSCNSSCDSYSLGRNLAKTKIKCMSHDKILKCVSGSLLPSAILNIAMMLGMRFFFVCADTKYKIHTLNNVCVTPVHRNVECALVQMSTFDIC